MTLDLWYRKVRLDLEPIVIKIEELETGSVVAQDLYANTQYPIIHQNTAITEEHLHVLKAFNIEIVPIVNGTRKRKEGLNELGSEGSERDQHFSTSFEKMYFDAVEQFKREFHQWEYGIKVNIEEIRNIMLPIVEEVLVNRTIIFALNSYSNAKDYLYHHCISIGIIAAKIGNQLGFDRGTIIQLAIAGTLADCGMSKVPKTIRNKKEALNEKEFTEIRKHPVYSYGMIKDIPTLKSEMKIAISQHHERLDGSGYPLALKAEKISQYAQIIAVSDMFHAMTNERLYRSKESPFKVIEMIKEDEFGKFDIQVVQAFINLFADLPIGTKVELNNKQKGIIMFINRYTPTRPILKVDGTDEILDLSQKRSCHISRIMPD